MQTSLGRWSSASSLPCCSCWSVFLPLTCALYAPTEPPSCCELLVTDTPSCCKSGKPQFSYIYGVALLGSASIYCLLNLMSEGGIDAYRTASVLGYCLLPLVLLSILSIAISLECVKVGRSCSTC